MICKEPDVFIPASVREAAGRRAEETLAEALGQSFGRAADVHVLHDLRLELGGMVARMSHLVIHARGMVVVESRGLAGRVRLGDDGRWAYLEGEEARSMPSPMQRARQQAEVLRAELARATGRGELLGRLPIDVLVVAVDAGQVQWPAAGPPPEACAAADVETRVRSRMAALEAAGAPLWFAGPNLKKTSDFLRRVHKPLPAGGRSSVFD